MFSFFSLSVNSQEIVRDIGDYVQVALPLTGLGVCLIHKDKKGVAQLMKSLVVQTGTTWFLKKVINKKRPNGGSYSLPSGHTSLSFMGSTFLWKRYGWKYGVPATIAAGFVGYSRAGIENPVHHPTDVLAGAAIGIVSSLIFTRAKTSEVEMGIIGDTSFVGVRFKFNLGATSETRYNIFKE